jgi:radical SAM superfamily enzyme YgiQ (UPF0313 family)
LKIHFLEVKNKLRKYTDKTLRYLCRYYGIEIASEEDADLILVTIDDPDDLRTLKRARKIAGHRPVIAGGFEGFGGEYLLAYADGINVGEGFEFFEALGKAKSVDSLLLLPYVLTKDKNVVYPSTRIDCDKLPVVRIRPKLWYYLAGRGCVGKCAFCATSFYYPRWHNSDINIQRVLKYIEGEGGRLTLITNDSAEIKVQSKARSVQSVRIKDYLRNPARFQKSNMLHFGIEGFSEEQRRYFGKPISNELITELIHVTGERKQQIEFFFVPGLPDTYEAMMKFAESVPVCAYPYPRIMIKLTRLDPSPHTPLWTYDIRQIERLTDEQIDEFHNVLKARNIRFRLFPMRGNARQTYKGVLRRCSPDETITLGTEPKAKDSDEAFMERLDKKGLGHLLTYDGRPMPNSQIITPWRDLRDRMADKRGMIPVHYKATI